MYHLNIRESVHLRDEPLWGNIGFYISRGIRCSPKRRTNIYFNQEIFIHEKEAM